MATGATRIRPVGGDGRTREQDVLSAVHVPWRLEPREPGDSRPGGGEIGWMRAHELTRSRIVESSAAPVGGWRGPEEIARTEDEWIVALIQLRGRMVIGGGEESLELRPGGVVVWDSTAPAWFDIKKKDHKRSVFFPREFLSTLCPTLDARPMLELPSADPAVGLFRAVTADVARYAPDLDDMGRYASSRALAELLVACLRPRVLHGRAALQAALFKRACAHVEGRLEDPDLSPGVLAAELKVPLRTLQDVFAQRGHTVRGYVKALRLGRAHLELSRADGRGVTEIAFAVGFANAGHFSRSFHERYGASPREVRATALSRQRRGAP
ncbi:helix-turn-helix domain-containing protein [Streptomyces sp. T028]|uniref:helix-turn-helix domain-containing protein n=1 Tax=Streptomyces sp. T028 TaxID=3394379 RepID=UPI003A85D8BE